MMFSCPHCNQTLVSGARNDVKVDAGVMSGKLLCSHCHAILRVEITTLRDPDPKLLATRKAASRHPITYCSKCDASVLVSELAKHKCSYPAPTMEE